MVPPAIQYVREVSGRMFFFDKTIIYISSVEGAWATLGDIILSVKVWPIFCIPTTLTGVHRVSLFDCEEVSKLRPTLDLMVSDDGDYGTCQWEVYTANGEKGIRPMIVKGKVEGSDELMHAVLWARVGRQGIQVTSVEVKHLMPDPMRRCWGKKMMELAKLYAPAPQSLSDLHQVSFLVSE